MWQQPSDGSVWDATKSDDCLIYLTCRRRNTLFFCSLKYFRSLLRKTSTTIEWSSSRTWVGPIGPFDLWSTIICGKFKQGKSPTKGQINCYVSSVVVFVRLWVSDWVWPFSVSDSLRQHHQKREDQLPPQQVDEGDWEMDALCVLFT